MIRKHRRRQDPQLLVGGLGLALLLATVGATCSSPAERSSERMHVGVDCAERRGGLTNNDVV
jgi:hypothetical protein